MDSHRERMFELKLQEIYQRTEWLQYELPMNEFVALFPVEYKNDRPLRPEMPAEPELDRTTRLAIMVAFREAFS